MNEEYMYPEENLHSRKNAFTEEIQKDEFGLFSYKVNFQKSDIDELRRDINQFLAEKFDSADISDFTGNIELNVILINDFDSEQNSITSIIEEEVIEKIKLWIGVTGKDFILRLKVDEKEIFNFTLTEKKIKEDAVKNKQKVKKRGGCFFVLLKFIYLSGFLTSILLGIYIMQEGRIKAGIQIISLSIVLFSIPITINSYIQRKRNKLKNK